MGVFVFALLFAFALIDMGKHLFGAFDNVFCLLILLDLILDLVLPRRTRLFAESTAAKGYYGTEACF